MVFAEQIVLASQIREIIEAFDDHFKKAKFMSRFQRWKEIIITHQFSTVFFEGKQTVRFRKFRQRVSIK